MGAVQIALGIALLIMAIFLVVAVLMQSGSSKKLSGSIAGGAETFFGKNKGKTLDKMFSKLTNIVSIIFVIVVLATYYYSAPAKSNSSSSASSSTSSSTTSSVTSSASQTASVESGDASVAEKSEVEIPKALIDNQIENDIKEMEYRMMLGARLTTIEKIIMKK